MTQRPGARRRIAASILGVDRAGRRFPTLEQQRRLSLGRRVLASLLGIGVRPSAPATRTRAAVTPPAPEHAPEPTVPEPTTVASRTEHPDHVPEAVPRSQSTSRRTTWATAPAGDRFAVPVHLLNEDRSDYERTLDAALRSAPHRPELAALGRRLNVEQLRTMALDATAVITAAAGSEYRHYVKVRDERLGPAMSAPSSRATAPAQTDPGAPGSATTAGEVAETGGAGLAAVIAVLGPVLAGTGAAILLLVGYILRMLNPETPIARTIITTGWLFGAVTGASLLVAAVGLLLTALRNEPGRPPDEPIEVTRARDAWLEALLERGIMPFLREALTDPASAETRQRTVPPPPAGRTPGFTSPDFTSPDFTSSDFPSPGHGGPERRPE